MCFSSHSAACGVIAPAVNWRAISWIWRCSSVRSNWLMRGALAERIDDAKGAVDQKVVLHVLAVESPCAAGQGDGEHERVIEGEPVTLADPDRGAIRFIVDRQDAGHRIAQGGEMHRDEIPWVSAFAPCHIGIFIEDLDAQKR